MIPHIAHFELSNEKHWGILEGEQIRVLSQRYVTTAELLEDKAAIFSLIKNGLETLKKVPLSSVRLLSPVVGNKRVICQGANYRQHMIESGMDPDAKTYNMFFNKSSAAMCGPSDTIIKPAHVSLLDYEIELALVIGKAINKQSQIDESKLSDYIAGVVIANDVSARDVQLPETQFFKGKSYRTFCPLGPYLALLDASTVCYLKQLELTLKVNGEIRQQDSTENLVFKPAETLTELSGFSDLDIGDILLTGTPSGCALRIPSPMIVKLFSLLPESTRWKLFKRIQGKRPQYLKENDTIEATIQSRDNTLNLGTQHNLISNR